MSLDPSLSPEKRADCLMRVKHLWNIETRRGTPTQH